MARRRYQNPKPYKVGKHIVRWEISYRKDIRDDGGSVRRIRAVETLGYWPEMTEKQARRAAQAVVEPLNAPSYTPSRIAPFRVIAQRWQETVMPELKPSSQAAARSHIAAHLLPAFGETQMHNFTPEMLQSWVASKIGTVSRKTLKNVVMTFRSVWRTAMAWGYASENPLDKIILRSAEKTEARCFTEDEVRKILMAAEGPYKVFYRLAAETGMRAGELCGLRWEDVDSDPPMIRVRQSSWRGHIGSPKSLSGSRAFPISDGLAQDILALRHWRVAKSREPQPAGRGKPPVFKVEYIYDPAFTAPTDSFVFRTSNGTPWDQNMVVKRHLHPLLVRLSIPRAGLHAFRHFVATQLDRHQATGAVMKQRLGHASLTTTDRYIHVVSEDAKRIAEALAIAREEKTGGVQ